MNDSHVFLLVPGEIYIQENRAYNFTPLGRIYIRGTTQIPYVKMKIIFTFTIRLLTHVTSEETSYPTKSMLSALEFFRYAARVGISILLEPQEAFQPVTSLSVRKKESYCARSLPLL